MAGARDPDERVNHVLAVKNAAARARPLLSPVLRQLQDAALGNSALKVQTLLLRAAEHIAEALGMLFELEHQEKDTIDSLVGAVRARDHLRTALSALQEPGLEGAFPTECADAVASALAIVFSAARGGDWKERDALRRARNRALAARLPIGAVQSGPALPARAQAPGAVEAVPQSQRAQPSRGIPQPSGGASSGPPSGRGAPHADEQRPRDRGKWNRRITGRTVLEVDVGFVSESHFYAGLSMDLSTGGLFVATYQLQPVGTPVAVSLVMPDGHAVWAKGVVRWVREPRGEDVVPGVGIAFTSIEPADLEAVRRFCELRPPMYHESDE